MRRTAKWLLLPLLFSACTSKPVVVVENDNIDLGVVYNSDSPVKTVIRLTNNGGKDLKITEVKTDCGCTTVQHPHGSIAPGKQVELPVMIDIQRYAPQEMESVIGIYTNLVDTPIVVHAKMTIENKSYDE